MLWGSGWPEYGQSPSQQPVLPLITGQLNETSDFGIVYAETEPYLYYGRPLNYVSHLMTNCSEPAWAKYHPSMVVQTTHAE